MSVAALLLFVGLFLAAAAAAAYGPLRPGWVFVGGGRVRRGGGFGFGGALCHFFWCFTLFVFGVRT